MVSSWVIDWIGWLFERRGTGRLDGGAQVCKAADGHSDSCEGTMKGGLNQLYDSFHPPTRDSDAAGGCQAEQVATAARSSVGVAGLVLDFACLRTAEQKPCGPAIIKAIADGGLQGVLTKGTKDGLNMQQVRVCVCPSCAGSPLNTPFPRRADVSCCALGHSTEGTTGVLASPHLGSLCSLG